MLRVIWLVTLVAFVSFSGGCAQMVRGSTTPVIVNSAPEGAFVQLSTGQECQTPCVLQVDRKSSPTLRISMDGYQPATAQLISQFNVTWFLLDMIITGPFAFISFAGGLYDITPNTVYVTLLPVIGRTDLMPKRLSLRCESGDSATGPASCSIKEVESGQPMGR